MLISAARPPVCQASKAIGLGGAEIVAHVWPLNELSLSRASWNYFEGPDGGESGHRARPGSMLLLLAVAFKRVAARAFCSRVEFVSLLNESAQGDEECGYEALALVLVLGFVMVALRLAVITPERSLGPTRTKHAKTR